MPAFAGRSPRPLRLRRFLDGDEAQSKRQAGFAFDPDRPIDPSVRGAVPEFGQNIDRLAIGIAPTGIPPGLARTTRSAPASRTAAIRSASP
jgi:hypothetical protein